MPAGIQVINDVGTIQIDQSYISLAMSAKGNCAMAYDPAPHPQAMSIGQVTVTGQNPIIAILPPNASGGVNLMSRTQSGNQFTFYFRAKNGGSFSLPYWVFDSATYGLGGGQGFGIQIFREDGALVFDAGTKPVRITGVIDLEPIAGSTYGSVSVPGGRTYAIVQGSFALGIKNVWDGWRSQYGDDELSAEAGDQSNVPPWAVGQYMDDRSYHSVAWTDGSTIYGGMQEFEQFRTIAYLGAPDVETVHGDLMFWTVDVTNY